MAICTGAIRCTARCAHRIASGAPVWCRACGCCPWTACPNIKPALEALRSMGFTKVKALYIPTNLAKDWTEKGYPVENGPAAP